MRDANMNKVSKVKIQHFVPQFFQRYFSHENNGKTIGMFNIESGVFKASVPIRTQSYKDYFYGKSGELETWLSELESKSAPIFRAMWEKEQLPVYKSAEHLDMVHFALILDLRNPLRFNLLEDLATLISNTKSSIREGNIPTNLIPKFKELQTERGKLSSLTSAHLLVPELLDLKFKLIRNKTAKPFIISDNPLIMYNQFLEKRNWNFMSNSDYGLKGLQMFLPVNDQYVLMIYDSEIYKVGNKKDKIIDMDDEKCIDQLNILQILNSSNIVNFNHCASEYYIQTLVDKSKRFKKANEAFIKVHPIKEKSSDSEANIQINELGMTNLETNLNIQKVKFTTKSKYIKLEDRNGQYRKNAKLTIVKPFVVPSIVYKPI